MLCRWGNGPAAVVAEDASLASEPVESEAEAFVTDAESGPELGAGAGFLGESGEDIVVEGAGGIAWRDGIDDGEVGVEVGLGRAEAQGGGVRIRSGAVLGGEGEGVTLAAEEEAGIGPGVEVAGAAEVLAGGAGATVLAGVVNDGDGDVKGSLEVAEVGEQGRDIAGEVFIDAVESDEGVEEEEAGAQVGKGVAQTVLVGVEVETQTGGRDDVTGQGGELDAAVAAQAAQAGLDGGGGVLGHVEEGRAGVVDVEGVEAWGGGGDGESEVEADPGFARLRGTTNDTDSGPGPKAVDEPAALGTGLFEVTGPHDGQGA